MDKHGLQKRLKLFAHRCLKLAETLPSTPAGKYFQNQLIHAAFSSAANYRAACIGQSRAAFVAKLSLAFEEADESCFWLENIIDSELIKRQLAEQLYNGSVELAKILGAARKNSQ